MPLAPVIAAALALGLPARTKGLYIDGLDAVKAPGTGGNTFGVPIETVTLVEEGPGRVSGLTFTIDDPMATYSVGTAQVVRFDDITRGVPLFLGFIDTFNVVPRGVGRTIDVVCVGIEILLDWMIVPALTIAPGTDPYSAVGATVAAATGMGWAIRVNGEVADSSQATPVSFGLASTYPIVTNRSLVLDGMTLRQALDTIGAAVTQPGVTPSWVFTIDFYLGLRVWSTGGPYTGNRPTDWQGPSTTVHANLTYAAAVGDATHQVYVTGGNAAGTGLVTDGTGLPGQVATLTDTSILTAAARDAAGLAYINDRGVTQRGTFDLEETATANIGSVGAEVHPFTPALINDTQAGLASTFLLTSFTKRFHPSGKETWSVEFGSSAQGKASSYLRQLTAGRIR